MYFGQYNLPLKIQRDFSTDENYFPRLSRPDYQEKKGLAAKVVFCTVNSVCARGRKKRKVSQEKKDFKRKKEKREMFLKFWRKVERKVTYRPGERKKRGKLEWPYFRPRVCTLM